MYKALFSFLILFLGVSCKHDSLPTIEIVKYDNSIPWNVKDSCSLKYSIGESIVEMPANIKFRGGYSSRFHKHSFALELDKKYSFENLPKDDDWIINANYIDKTFMRHKISYDLFKQMSLENKASACAYVNLYLNENYEGLYVFMQEVNAGMLGVNKKDSMAMVFKDPPIFYKERLAYVQDSLNYYQQKYPKIENRDNSKYLERFKTFLFESNDKDFVKYIRNWIDIDNVIDWHILLLFSNNGDGVMKNFLLYKRDSKSPFKITIWDYDHSFGRDGDNELNMGERGLRWERSILLKRLMELPQTNYKVELKNRWLELRNKNIISYENFERLVNDNDAVIGNEIERNFEKWPVNSKSYYDSNSYEMELELMLEFVKVRIEHLDEIMR